MARPSDECMDLAVPTGSGWIIEIGGGLGRLAFNFLRRLCEMDDEIGHTDWRPAIQCEQHNCFATLTLPCFAFVSPHGMRRRECAVGSRGQLRPD
jgi:hypothetical protein